jgi:Mn-containing catalase
MLLTGINGELKNAAEESDLNKMLDGNEAKETYINDAMLNPQFFIVSGGTPTLTDSVGNPWTASYIMGMGDLTADLRLNIGAETSAKMVYENLMKFTDDIYVKETLRFLMTREVAHSQMFQAALDSIQPNFPPGILESDPKFSNKYFNMSKGDEFKGPWNTGMSPLLDEEWKIIDDPHQHVIDTQGLLEEQAVGTDRTEALIQDANKRLSAERKAVIDKSNAHKNGYMSWSEEDHKRTHYLYKRTNKDAN